MSNLRRLFGYMRPYLSRTAGGIAVGCAVAVLGACQPLLTRAVIDGAIRRGDGGRLAVLIGIIVAIGIVKALCFGLRRQWSGEVSVGAEGDLREELYEHVQALDTGYHERVSTGQVMARASSDLQAVRQLLMVLPWSITLTVQLLVVMAVMLTIDWHLALAALATTPLMAWSTLRFVRRFDPVVWQVQQKIAELASVVEETITGIRVVKAFGREQHQVDKLTLQADGIFEHSMVMARLRATFVGSINLLPQLSVVAVLWYGGRRVLGGHISLGTLVAFNAYLLMLMWPIRALGMITASAQRAVTSSGRIFEVLDTAPGIADRPGAGRLEAPAGAVRFEGVRFGYPGAGPVLDGVDLDVAAGTSLALVGPTGCGKSTLIKLLPRFIEVHGGRVLIDGTDVGSVTLRSLRSKIGMVFEDTFLFSDSIRANIAFGRPDAADDEVVAAACIAQAHDFISELPEGYDAVIGEQGYTLSGGQRQRLAIARAVLMDPRLLILDDATSAVDPKVETAIRSGLKEAMRGRTTLIVARRPSTAALADRVAYMEAGRIVATGTHDELWRAVEAYREALGGDLDEAGLERSA